MCNKFDIFILTVTQHITICACANILQNTVVLNKAEIAIVTDPV